VPEDGGGAVAVVERKLTGMACLLKESFVGYLRELAKITPPVPKQVLTHTTLLHCFHASFYFPRKNLFTMENSYKHSNRTRCCFEEINKAESY
jgi:hypothetical protein